MSCGWKGAKPAGGRQLDGRLGMQGTLEQKRRKRFGDLVASSSLHFPPSVVVVLIPDLKLVIVFKLTPPVVVFATPDFDFSVGLQLSPPIVVVLTPDLNTSL